MANQFPTTLNAYVTGASSSTLSAAGHADVHNKLESKIGVDSSAVVTSLDYLLKSTSSTDPGHKHTLTSITDVTASVAELNYIDGVTSAIQTQLDLKAPLISPSFTTPTLGVATATSINKVTITAPTTSATLTLVTGSSLVTAGAYSLTLTTTNTTVATLPAGTVTLVGTAATQTLTNKRNTKRCGTTTSSATPTINTDNYDYYEITAQAEAITSFTTNLSGTPTENQTLWLAITGTAARAITWGTSFESSTVTLPTTTVTTARLDVGFAWNSVTSKWRCVAVS